jgi:lipopolysaccharide export system permease protein
LRVLNRYLIQDFLVVFAMTLLIFTFVMCLGVVVKAIDFAARGISATLMAKVFLYNVPFMLTFSIPMSTLTAVLLMFGRLSFDGELTAMKASGLTMWQIVSPVVLLAMACSVVCVQINTTVAPRCRQAVRDLLSDLGSDEPINLLEPGRFISDFPDMMIYIGSRNGHAVKDVVVYMLGDNGPVRNVRAASGELSVDSVNKVMLVDLHDVRIDQSGQDGDKSVDKTQYINAEHYPLRMDFSGNKKKARLRPSDMTFAELIDAIRNVRTAFPELKVADLMRQRMTLAVEANKRMALSLSCFAFTLLGIPLGMSSKRKESSIGILYSLGLVFVFYLFIIVANSLVDRPALRPDLIVWIPVALMEVLGFVMIRRTE